MNNLFPIEKVKENATIENSNCLSIKFIPMTQPKARTDDRKWSIWNDIIDRELYFVEQIPYRTSLEMAAFANNSNDDYYNSLYDIMYEDDEPYRYENLYYRWPKEQHELYDRALHLVRDSIKWTRKWSQAPAFLHSMRVADRLFLSGYSLEIQLAGLLHDIIEDGWYTKERLLEIWFSRRVVELVDLCSHDKTIEDSFERWQKMIKRLKETNDKDAWAIKVCDIIDNLSECDLMEDKKLERFLFKKAPVFRELIEEEFKWTGLEKNFYACYEEQLKKWNNNHSK